MPNENKVIKGQLDDQGRIALRALCLTQMHLMHTMSHNSTATTNTSNGKVHRASTSYVSDMENGELKTLSCSEPMQELAQASIEPTALHATAKNSTPKLEPPTIFTYPNSYNSFDKTNPCEKLDPLVIINECSPPKSLPKFDFYPFSKKNRSLATSESNVLLSGINSRSKRDVNSRLSLSTDICF